MSLVVFCVSSSVVVLWIGQLSVDVAFLCHSHLVCVCYIVKNKGSYISAHVLSNLLNEFGKRDKMRGLSRILSFIRNECNLFNNTRARMLYSIYHMTFILL